MITYTKAFKEFAWKMFENTGSIDAYLLYREISDTNMAFCEKQAAQDEVAISG